MTGVDGVADSSIQRFQARSRNPTVIHHLNDSTERTFGDDALLLIFHIGEMQLVLTVPATQGSQSVGVSHPEAVVARTSLELFCRWIELGVVDD